MPPAPRPEARPPNDQVDGLCEEWVQATSKFHALAPGLDAAALLERHWRAAPDLYRAFDNFLAEVDRGRRLTGAADRKAAANAAFQEGRHAEAALGYTHALAAARTDAECAVLLANRANAHLQLGNAAAALLDAHAALALDARYAKGYHRRGHALRRLGLTAEAQQDLDHSDALEKSPGTGSPPPAPPLAPRTTDLVADLRHRLRFGPAGEDVLANPAIRVHPALELRRDAAQGRHWATASGLAAGTVVVSELPLAAALRFERHAYTHCAWGLAAHPALVPSPEYRARGLRSRGLYSGPEAAAEEWAAWGSAEARHPFFLVCPLDFLLAARLYLRKARPPLPADRAPEPGAAHDDIGGGGYGGFEHVAGLEGRSAETDGPPVTAGGHETACVALALHAGAVRTLVLCCDVPGGPDGGDGGDRGPDVAVSAGMLAACCRSLVHLMRVVLTNGAAVTKLTAAIAPGGATATVRQERVGKAVYGVASLFNHSCDPNCHLQWAGGPYEATPRLLVRTSTAIPAGAPLTLSYGPHKNRHHSAALRRRLLREQYGFECHCSACCAPESAVVVTDEVQAVWRKASDLYQKGRRLAGDGRHRDALDALMGSLDLLTRHLPEGAQPPHVVAKTYDAIAEVHGLTGDFGGAATWCLRAVRRLEDLYGSDSLEIAGEYDKLAGLLVRARRYPEALHFIGRAVPLLRCFYGDLHEGIRELGEYQAAILREQPGLEAAALA